MCGIFNWDGIMDHQLIYFDSKKIYKGEIDINIIVTTIFYKSFV